MDPKVIDAVRFYRESREKQSNNQGAVAGIKDMGARSAVTGGAQMDGFADLVSSAIMECGIPSNCIYKKKSVELPGYYRPEKQWDLLVVYNGILGAAIEFKSQVGPSFGNNFNNRTEEALGSASDIWVAYREGRFGKHMIKPWLGYLFLLEDCPRSTTPVAVREPHFQVDEVFRGASYKKRYVVFCQRLILERLYDSACFLTSNMSGDEIIVQEPNPGLSFDSFISSLKGHMKILVGFLI